MTSNLKKIQEDCIRITLEITALRMGFQKSELEGKSLDELNGLLIIKLFENHQAQVFLQ